MSLPPNSKHRLELVWPDKERCARPEPRILLEKKTYRGKKKGVTDNLLIQGDNLLGLKALETEYTGKIRCIYIDPPYNTRSCFPNYYDDSMEHSMWLDMMRDRLLLLHKLLSSNGSIWISIDAYESHYLKTICDEIFGRKNFIDEVVWERAYAPINLKKTLSRNHDYILVYAKNAAGFELNKLKRSDEANARYKNPDYDDRGLWKPSDLSVGPIIEEKVYPITTPSGRIVYPPKGYCWRLSKARFKEYLSDSRIWFGKDGNNVPSIKRFLSEVKNGITPLTLWKREDVGDTQEAKREAKLLNSSKIFPTPKPERLIERILHLASDPGDLVLDCFAGSGTTGAVAHKMNRRWIMVEMSEPAKTHIIPRLEKVIQGEDPNGITESVQWEGGGGFQFKTIAPSLLVKKKLDRWVINPKYTPEMLRRAMCLHAGFSLARKSESWWCHGQSTQGDYIYITPESLSRTHLARMSDEVGSNRSLLVFCAAYNCKEDEFPNLTIKKIPRDVLAKCDWDIDDYSLKDKPRKTSTEYRAIKLKAAAKQVTSKRGRK